DHGRLKQHFFLTNVCWIVSASPVTVQRAEILHGCVVTALAWFLQRLGSSAGRQPRRFS
ncbi:hypothetical protein KXW41_002358, partial [Aspergillus fumigatus]